MVIIISSSINIIYCIYLMTMNEEFYFIYLIWFDLIWLIDWNMTLDKFLTDFMRFIHTTTTTTTTTMYEPHKTS